MSITEEMKQEIVQHYGKLPLTFVPNAGQIHEDVHYYSPGSGRGIYLTREEAVFTFLDKTSQEPRDRHKHRLPNGDASPVEQTVQGIALSLRFLGANPKANLEGQEEGDGKVHYLKGNDPNKWIRNLSTFEEVIYRELWPGVDLIFLGENGQLKYTFVVQPGAPIEPIQLTYRGADDLTLDEAGNLRIHTPYGILTDERPVSVQEIEGQPVAVTSSFVLGQDEKGEQVFGFAVGNDYDPRYPLLIDPGLVYSTYLGGSSTDEGFGIAVDAGGNAYVTGFTSSPNFPVTPGAFQTTAGGGVDAFVTKLNPAGSALVYSTYLGGSSSDTGSGIAVDVGGNAYVTGQTDSPNFPVTPGAFQTTLAGGFDAFVTKLNPAGSALVYSTYLGGSSEDDGFSIAVDGMFNAYVTGLTESTNFPVTPGAFQITFGGGLLDAFVTKLNPAGSALVYSTYLGGSSDDEGRGIAVDGGGNAYVTGLTSSPNFPVTPGAFQTTFAGGDHAYVTKLNPTGTTLVYSTYLGGSGLDVGFDIAVDPMFNAYVTGFTNSTNFPVTPGSFQTTFGGGPFDAFVTKLNPTGSTLVYSTYLGGSSEDQGRGIAVDVGGNAYVTGLTNSTNFPVTPGAFQTTLAGGFDAFVSKLNPTGTTLVYSTYLGGSSTDEGFGIAVDPMFNAYVTGLTNSTDFPVTTGSFQTTFGGGLDAFVTKLRHHGPHPPHPPH